MPHTVCRCSTKMVRHNSGRYTHMRIAEGVTHACCFIAVTLPMLIGLLPSKNTSVSPRCVAKRRASVHTLEKQQHHPQVDSIGLTRAHSSACRGLAAPEEQSLEIRNIPKHRDVSTSGCDSTHERVPVRSARVATTLLVSRS